MSGRSSIDSLRRLSSVSDVEAAEVFGVAGREELLADVTSLPYGRRRRAPQATRRRRRPLVLAFALVAAAATAAGAWAVLHGSAAQETTSVECVIKGVDTIIPSTSGDPAQDCAVEWKGELGTAAPPLRAYDNGHGGVTVLVRSETPPGGFKRLVSGQDADLIQLQDSLDDWVNGLNSSCLSSAAGANLTRTNLARFGFTGWTVVLGDRGSGGGNCWNVEVVDPSAQTVTLLAGPRQKSGTPAALADKLQPLTQSCESLPDALASVRAAASSLGLSESARTYDLNAVADDSMHCASIYETVGGTIFLTVRGPRH
jgi:hypothetical protein